MKTGGFSAGLPKAVDSERSAVGKKTPRRSESSGIQVEEAFGKGHLHAAIGYIELAQETLDEGNQHLSLGPLNNQQRRGSSISIYVFNLPNNYGIRVSHFENSAADQVG